jgi:excisionase family DNA binding protein
MPASQSEPRGTVVMHRIADAVTISRLCRSTIYNHIRSGALKSVKVGGARLISDEALRKLLKIEEAGEG